MALYFADECVAADIVLELRTVGPDVVHAKEVCPGASDREVLRLAEEAGRVLVTDDLGFGELAVRYANPRPASSYFQSTSWPPASANAMPLRRSTNCWTVPLGHLAVIEPGRLRLRPLPGRGP